MIIYCKGDSFTFKFRQVNRNKIPWKNNTKPIVDKTAMSYL